MCRDDELRRASGDLVPHLREEDELTLWRQRGFRFVQEKQACSEAMFKDRQERLAVRAGMQGSATIATVWIIEKLGIFTPGVE